MFVFFHLLMKIDGRFLILRLESKVKLHRRSVFSITTFITVYIYIKYKTDDALFFLSFAHSSGIGELNILQIIT